MMKKLILAFCMLQGILLSLGAQDMHQNIAYADNYVRFTVISDGTLRLEYAPDGKFVDNKSFVAVNRLYPDVDYKLKSKGAWIEITSARSGSMRRWGRPPHGGRGLKLRRPL